jgi:cell division protein FtsI/penicillin-binding protein 2
VINNGLVGSVDQAVPCPQYLTGEGVTLHNSDLESGVGNDFLEDFAQSCNNAFSSFYNKTTNVALAQTAQKYYGFNEPWNVGLDEPTVYGYVPDGSSNALIEELVGQDKIATSPLAMASVAATIDQGSFKQPILVPGVSQISATPLPSGTDSDIKEMMHAVVTQPEGTLYGVFPDTNNLYAKTGTAEDGAVTNAWTIAFRGDYAICDFVYNGQYGATSAGPQVRSILNQIDP